MELREVNLKGSGYMDNLNFNAIVSHCDKAAANTTKLVGQLKMTFSATVKSQKLKYFQHPIKSNSMKFLHHDWIEPFLSCVMSILKYLKEIRKVSLTLEVTFCYEYHLDQ